MKTTEEKAKAYDEALERAKTLYENANGMILKKWVEQVFPELRETDDEKIRKELIKHLKEGAEGYEPAGDSSDYQRWLAWLEKQSEKPADKIEPKFKVGDKIYLKPEYRMPDDDTPIANTVKEIRRIDDKHYRFDGAYIFIEDQDKYELVEQEPEENKGNIGGISPTWSEEDEKNLRRAIRATKVVYPVAADWLQSLQDRVQPQPKQEWKQENTCDLTAFENAMMHIGGSFFGQHAGLDPNDTNSIKEQANLLLELVPSKEWSEEDEEILRTILSDGIRGAELDMLQVNWLKSIKRRVQPKPMCKFGDTELTEEEVCEGLIRGMVDEHNRVTKEVLRTEYEKGRADVLAKIDAIDVDEMVCESGATSRVTQYWYAHGVNDVIKKLKDE